MAQIERYQQRTRLSGESPNTTASAEQFSASGKAISQIGGALSEVAASLTKAQEHQQKTMALNKAKMLKSEIIAKYAADPNPDNYDQYVQELHNVQSVAGEGMTLRNAQTAFQLDYGSELNSGLMEMNKLKRTKIVELGTMAVSQELEQHVTDFLNADPQDEGRILQNIDLALEAGMANGYFTPKEAQEMREKNVKTIGSEKVGRQLNQAMQSGNVAQIEQIKENLLTGSYEQNGVEIDAAAKKSLLGTLDSAIKKVSQEQSRLMKETQDRTEAEFGKRAVGTDPNLPELSLDDINKAEVLKQITPAYANILRKYKTEPVVKATRAEKAAGAARLGELLYDIDSDADDTIDKGVTFDQLAKFRIAAFEAHQKQGITTNKLQAYLDATEAAYRDSFQKSDIGAPAQTKDGAFNMAKKVWRAITGQPQTNDEMKAFVFDKLNEQMRTGAMTEEQIPTVIRDIQRSYYIANDPKEAKYEPDQIVTVGGRRFKTYLRPDGRMAFEAQ